MEIPQEIPVVYTILIHVLLDSTNNYKEHDFVAVLRMYILRVSPDPRGLRECAGHRQLNFGLLLVEVKP